MSDRIDWTRLPKEHPARILAEITLRTGPIAQAGSSERDALRRALGERTVKDLRAVAATYGPCIGARVNKAGLVDGLITAIGALEARDTRN